MRIVVSLAALAVLATASFGQIVSVKLKDAKAAKKYKKLVVPINGYPHLVGEIKSGVPFKNGGFTVSKVFELWVADPGDPSKVPYKVQKGVKVVANRKGVVEVSREHIVPMAANPIKYLIRDQTLIGLASEYGLKLEKLAGLKKQRDAHAKGAKEWFEAQRVYIDTTRRLRTWLSATGFSKAAKKLDRKITSEAKLMKEDAVAARARRGEGSVKTVEPPSELLRANEASPKPLRFAMQESEHIRIIYCPTLSNQLATELLRLGERIIEGFRREFVDPYIEDGVEDHIADSVMTEFCFVTDDKAVYQHYWEAFYGRDWGTGPDRARRLTMAGTGGRAIRPGATYFHYWKSSTESDFQGIIAHELGHDLSNAHFNRNRRGDPQEWLREAVGYYLAFEFLGRNGVTCYQFKRSKYDQADPGKEGLKTLMEGQRAGYNDLALRKGVPIDQLAQKQLYQMDDADLAKSWSFFDYLARREGGRGVRWLISGCDQKRLNERFLTPWREESREILDVKDGDPFGVLERRWREFATTVQKKSGKRRR